MTLVTPGEVLKVRKSLRTHDPRGNREGRLKFEDS